MNEKITYMSVAEEYEKDYLDKVNKAKGTKYVHVPKFERVLYENFEDQEKSQLFSNLIETMVIASEKRFGDDYYLMMTPIQNYLYDKYGVDPIDLEFMGLVYFRTFVRANRNGVDSAWKQIKQKLHKFAENLDDKTLEELIKALSDDEKEE